VYRGLVAFPAKLVAVAVALVGAVVISDVWLGTTSMAEVVPSFGRGDAGFRRRRAGG
jgi:hypothetical protein